MVKNTEMADQTENMSQPKGFKMVKIYNLPNDVTYQFSYTAQVFGAVAVATICPESICYFNTSEEAGRFMKAIHATSVGGNTLRAEGHYIQQIDDFRSLMENFRVTNNVPMFNLFKEENTNDNCTNEKGISMK